MRVSSRKCAAFTLVELLVVIVILAILMALLFPAVNAIRESMRRAQCSSNLGDWGKAANAHVSKYDYFPSGGWGMMWLGDADRGTGPKQPGGWIYQLLPFVEYNLIHDLGQGQGSSTSVDTSSYKYTTAGPQMKSSVIPNIICLSRRKIQLYPDAISQGAYNSAPTNGWLNKTDYAANTGTADPTDAFDGPPTSCLGTFPNNCNWNVDATTGDGVVYQASQVKTSDIVDGLQYTFFAGEKSLSPNDTITVGGQSGKTGTYYNSEDPGDDNSALQGFDHDTVRWASAGLPPTQDGNGVSTTTNSFGSAHPAGCIFVFCDAHVGLVTYNVDPNVYNSWGCRNDGQNNEPP